MASSTLKDDTHFHRSEECLRLIDPILQFLTRSTSQDRVPLSLVRKAIPMHLGVEQSALFLFDIQTISFHGVLMLHRSADHSFREDIPTSSEGVASEPIQWEDPTLSLGFPLPSPHHKLHGSSKAAAKRRLTALRQKLQQQTASASKNLEETSATPCCDKLCGLENPSSQPTQASRDSSISEQISCGDDLESEDDASKMCGTTDDALKALRSLLAFPKSMGDAPSHDDDILPRQASYAGSTPAQGSIYASWSGAASLPPSLIRALGLEQRPLYSHQVSALEAAFEGTDCIVCTGTGSGKSLCYLLPALAAAYNFNQTSLLLFPTKALAQDQLTKLILLLASDEDLQRRIRPATLDGDTTFSARSRIHEFNILLTNPDILHTTVLPAWKTKAYQSMLASIRYVALDEAHMYDGVFGAHVAMILRRLVRIAVVAAISSHPHNTSSSEPMPPSAPPTFIATSATLPWPAEHFRLLCPIGQDRPIVCISKDGSPRSAKHFFVWNPPVLHLDGSSTGKIYFPKAKISGMKSSLTPEKSSNAQHNDTRKRHRGKLFDAFNFSVSSGCESIESDDISTWTARPFEQPFQYRRRHAAEETARLLARAVINGVRCIAFCKTRNLVEWIYTKSLEALESHPKFSKLSSLIESYRGGYSVAERRKIEDRLFHGQILAVVATSALELGVDIGGIDLTLHCGYPSSYSSLLQQAGRAGRGKDVLQNSVSVLVCFNSPSEQQMWRRPRSVLSTGPSSSSSISFHDDLVQGHLLCASEEFPLSRTSSLASIVGAPTHTAYQNISDMQLFGDIFKDNLASLLSSNSVFEEKGLCSLDPTKTNAVFKARPSFRKAWSRLSIRSIEPISYSIVDLSHPMQAGRNDGIYGDTAVLDTLPYSRVFFHAHPGAIITHRGSKYEIVSMTQPPAFSSENFSYRRSLQLAAYVRPTKVRYFTRPLSKTTITVIKQLESVEIVETKISESTVFNSCTNFAGCGAVSIKRQVRGYKRISSINYTELSRTELSLPPIEYDTFGLFICADPSSLAGVLGERYGPGVHALSHALCTVAPLFTVGLTVSDVECDHEFYAPTRVTLFDQRAGGSGGVQRLWKCFFRARNNILNVAIDLLKSCSSCLSDPNYDGGCPACIHASQCLKFNAHLSRSAAIVIGERMLERIKTTDVYKRTEALDTNAELRDNKAGVDITPRRRARQNAMRQAKELHTARDRQFVVGRVTWPLDQQQHDRLEHGE